MRPAFQEQWLAVVLLVASALAVYRGMRIALRREIDNPLVQLRGARALPPRSVRSGLSISRRTVTRSPR